MDWTEFREERRGEESRGDGPFNSCLVNSRTAAIFVEGFHSSTLSMPRHITPEFGGVSLLMFGW